METFPSAPFFRRPESDITHRVRAKFARNPDGSKRLLSVQQFSQPMFRERGYELVDRFDKSRLVIPDEPDICTDEDIRAANIHRAVRRAKNSCFDILECNPDMDAFGTMTISPEAANRQSWYECYGLMRVWLSNRVQRSGLKYVVIPEYHHDGKSIHFHAVFNREALRLERARSPTNGRLIYRDKKPVYNLADCDFGFSTVIPIDGENSQDKVAKYIFKYMGKQLGLGAKIGGRYYLHGGKLQLPVYEYGEEITEFTAGITPKHVKECTINGTTLTYREEYFV